MTDGGKPLASLIHRATAVVVVKNPFAGRFVGGGEALIHSNVKVAAAGASIDVPLGHKDNAWSFDHFDTLTIALPDAPRPDEIVVVVAVADGGRSHPRVGKGRAVV